MEWESIAVVVACVIYVVRLTLEVLLKYYPVRDLGPKFHSLTAPGWNRVAELFEKHVEGGHHRGCGFAVYHKGQLVVECVGGYADHEAEWLWDKITLCCIYGCTKGIGAVVIAMLVDRGLLDYSAPVANYWPEFAVNGKESITVEQLLSHQAGLIVLDEDYSFFDITANPDKLSRLLATARPQWKPGTAHGFHSLTLGLYMDQLVRRVDPQHRCLAHFFAEEVSWKFGIDCFIGLPKHENYRCARLEGFPLKMYFELLMNPKYWAWMGEENPGSNLMKMTNNNTDIQKFLYNNPAFREIPFASSNGYATVAGLAKLYGILANGGHHNSDTLLSVFALEKLNEPLSSGIDSVLYLDSTVGRGTIIMKSEDGHNIFGHSGFCGQAGFADPEHKVGWAYMSNCPCIYMYADDWRYRQLIDEVYETVKELERREVSH